MRIKLLSFKLSGVKSLQKEIELKFSNYLLKNPSENITKIKSIYGVNGAGKTSVVLGMKILIEFLRSPDYLSENRVILNELINFDTNTFSATALFSTFDDNGTLMDIFRYCVRFIKVEDSFVIDHESLDLLSGNNLKGTSKNIFDISKGQIQNINCLDMAYKQNLISKFNNLLLKSSFLSLHPTLEIKGDDETVIVDRDKYQFSYSIISLFQFAHSVLTFTDRDNIPLNPNQHFAMLKSYVQDQSNHPDRINNINENRIPVVKKNYRSFVGMTKQLEKFIQLFKPELKEIKLDAIEADQNYYLVSRAFDYGGKKLVNEYLESTGIKRISQLFQFLSIAVKGGIVFIDELDTSISGIYLLKLLQYFEKFGKGQLCFTCHNTYLMRALQDHRFSIDFISSEGKIKSWAKSGHYLPEDQFTKGYIPGFAFNTIDLDFFDVFPPEEVTDENDGR